ncbi:MAG: hypothetical protein V2A34_13320, partial [Lentisphaerota bacterium]
MKAKVLSVLASMMVLAATVRAGDDAAASVSAAKSLEQISVDAQTVLSKDKIQNTFDLYRKLKDYGLTYQASLTAPNNLVSVLSDEQLRLYAGVKLFDALYAVTFLKRQEVADCVGVIESIQDKLDLRSHADINNTYLENLKKAAAAPEDVDVQKLIEQLAADYVSEWPKLMSSVESADYVIDGLYGFIIEMSYITGAVMATASREQIEEGFDRYGSGESYKMVLDLFQAFDRMDEKIRVSGATQE